MARYSDAITTHNPGRISRNHRTGMVLLMLCLAFVPVRIAAQDRLIMRITGRDNGSGAATVTFGLHPDATYCIDGQIDSGLVEEELSPVPGGIFMLYFAEHRSGSSCLGLGTTVHIQRLEPCAKDTFLLEFTPSDGGYPFHFEWDIDSARQFDSMIMEDLFGGFLVRVDMRVDSTVTIPNPAVTSVRIITELVCLDVGTSPGEMPRDFSLGQNYPNPFNAETRIAYSIPVASDVTISIFDVLGREIGVLSEVRTSPGSHTIRWSAEDLPSGVYFYRFSTPVQSEMKKMTLLR